MPYRGESRISCYDTGVARLLTGAGALNRILSSIRMADRREMFPFTRSEVPHGVGQRLYSAVARLSPQVLMKERTKYRRRLLVSERAVRRAAHVHSRRLAERDARAAMIDLIDDRLANDRRARSRKRWLNRGVSSPTRLDRVLFAPNDANTAHGHIGGLRLIAADNELAQITRATHSTWTDGPQVTHELSETLDGLAAAYRAGYWIYVELQLRDGTALSFGSEDRPPLAHPFTEFTLAQLPRRPANRNRGA